VKAEEEAAKAKAVAGALKAAGAAKADKAAATVEKAEVKVAPSAGNVQQWAKWLSGELAGVPQIQAYSALRLSDLAEKGPAQARAVWLTAQAILGKDYGAVTIGELLSRFHP
jgi:L-ribulose-5-phosphate 3-epimerase UlaE